jgi:hypothetical protein
MKNDIDADMAFRNVAELLASSSSKEENGNYFGAIEDLERCKDFLKQSKVSQITDSRFKNACSNICRLMNIIAMVFLRKGSLIRKLSPSTRVVEKSLREFNLLERSRYSNVQQLCVLL